MIARASRVAVRAATPAFHATLRAALGLRPGGGALPAELGYCGREFRAYPHMRVGEAERFYGALHARWDGATLRADLAAAGVLERFEVRRMKRGYQRALVLALASAARPELLVVENGEDFDEPALAALLERATARAPRALVTYGAEAVAIDSSERDVISVPYDTTTDAADFDVAAYVRER